MIRFDILSLFPGYFASPFSESIIARAQETGIIDINLVDIRDFSEDKHGRVDDRPYGGGPGMVLMPDPVVKAVRSVRQKQSRVLFLSPQGERFNAQKARQLSDYQHLVLLCGHYEGIDQRALDLEVDEEVSIGDYVLTNGCLAAIVLLDAIARFIPGVIGDDRAAEQDSFEVDGLLDCPHYTRPPVFEGLLVPDVLQSGNHSEISEWRYAEALKKTKQVRSDLIYGR